MLKSLPLIDIKHAVALLKAGSLIAYPTEAVYGLGCDPEHSNAVLQLRQLKQRNDGRGIILVADEFTRIANWLAPIPDEQLAKVLASWPGHITWIFPASTKAPREICALDGTIAIRVSQHPIVQRLCKELQSSLVSTSANPFGLPPAMSPEEVSNYFPNQLAGIVEGELGGYDKPSQIFDALTHHQLR